MGRDEFGDQAVGPRDHRLEGGLEVIGVPGVGDITRVARWEIAAQAAIGGQAAGFQRLQAGAVELSPQMDP